MTSLMVIGRRRYWLSGLCSDVGVVVVVIHIGADAVTVGCRRYRYTGGRRSGTVAVGVDEVIDGSRVTVVAGIAGICVKVPAIESRRNEVFDTKLRRPPGRAIIGFRLFAYWCH